SLMLAKRPKITECSRHFSLTLAERAGRYLSSVLARKLKNSEKLCHCSPLLAKRALQNSSSCSKILSTWLGLFSKDMF
ncbi:hypothetical protein A2U01_0070005, partial [Trifolium medium]|nr:hypothetical protein [Trifolium medium]